MVVQRAYRQRLARKLLRTIRSMRETRRQEEAAARLRSAIKLQAVFRGSFLRHALRDVLNDEAQEESAPSSPSMRDRRKSRSRERRPSIERTGSFTGSRRARGSYEKKSEAAMRARASLQFKKEKKLERDRQLAAAGVIQRRARVHNARREVQYARAKRDDTASAIKLAVHDAGSALDRLRSLTQRNRVMRLTMLGVYADTLAVAAMPHAQQSANTNQ